MVIDTHVGLAFLAVDLSNVLTDLLASVLLSEYFLLLRLQDMCEHGGRIELDPLRCQHEVDVVVLLGAPVLQDFPKLELGDDLVRRDQRIHVRLEA